MSDNDTSYTKTPPRLVPWLIAGGAFVVALVVGLSVFFTYQNVISTGNQKEANMSSLYAQGATTLSTCLVQTSQAANVAQAESEALQEVFASAIAARYDTPAGQIDEGALFSAIVEAYPDVTGLEETFQQVISVIVGCRTDYANAQALVQVAVKDFNSWRTGSWVVRTFGGSEFPNDNLYIAIGDTEVYGQEAYEIMRKPIVDNSTITAYEEGVIEIEDPFPSGDDE
ncbi:MAG: hypothetical protein WAO28_01005 [Candidatus Microsaccharimonas sp.]